MEDHNHHSPFLLLIIHTSMNYCNYKLQENTYLQLKYQDQKTKLFYQLLISYSHL